MYDFVEALEQLTDKITKYCKCPALYMILNYQNARNEILKDINNLLADIEKVSVFGPEPEGNLSELRDVIFKLQDETDKFYKRIQELTARDAVERKDGE